MMYPIVKYPESGTVLYPYREGCRRELSRLKAGYCQWLTQQMPAGVVFRNDVGICVSDRLPLICPDMVILVEGRPEVRIAVEIDEPFEPGSRKPRHYISCGDCYRDGLMTRLGWIVIRLAESQVRYHHQASTDFLTGILSSYLPDTEWPRFAEEPLPEVKRWTKAEANKMAAKTASAPCAATQEPLFAMTPQEQQSMEQVKPFPRTQDMQEKMASFKDAGRYAQDADIDFEPEEHIYIYKGKERMLSVSALAGYFFDGFDALAAAERQMQYKGIPVEEALDTWDRTGCMASEVGTFMHAQTENYFHDGTFDTIYPFSHNGQTEPISIETEKEYFLQFVSDYGIEPYRQEWPVYDKELNVAGTIDLTCRNDDGSITIYDWKRSTKVVNGIGQPIVEAFGGKMSFNGINLPDTPFYHYCVQQNLYRYMLEQHYGVKVRATNLVVLHPTYPSYYVAQVPRMDDLVSKIIGVCKKLDLGHRLLVFLTAFLLTNAVNAQVVRNDTVTDRTHQLQEVTVTESRRQHVVTSTSPLHIVDREQMLTLGVTDVADALHRIPGVTLRDYGGAGGMKTVSVRGFSAKHTGVSYDGIMLSDCQSGEIDLSRYSLDNVEQISLVVGDNDDIFIPARNAASSAVLNVQTIGMPSGNHRPHLTAQLKAGAFGYLTPFMRYEQNLSDKFALSVVGEYTYAKNDYPYVLENGNQLIEENRANSEMYTGHGEVNFVWKADDFNRLSGKFYYYDNDRQLPGQVHYYTNVSKETLHDQNAFAQLLYQTHNRNGWSLKWHAKYNWNASIYRDPMTPNNNNDASYWQRELYNSAAVLYTPSEAWSLDYSLDYAFNNLNSSSERTIDNHPFRHTFLQSGTVKYRTGRVTALARMLYSIYLCDARFGESARNFRKLSPSVSVSYKLLEDEDLYLRLSYKNIFRAPTFNENYYYHLGSKDLLPETTDQINLGVTWGETHEALALQMTLDGYYNYVKDMIVAVPYNMFIWTCVNVGKVKVYGGDATASASYRINERQNLQFSGSYSFQSAENHTNPASPFYGYQIAYMPKHTGSVALGWVNPWISLSLHGSGVSSRWANNQHYEDTEIDGYWDMGLAAYHIFQLGDQQVEARFDLKNIFNTQYEIVRFYPMPRRSWQFSVKYQL